MNIVAPRPQKPSFYHTMHQEDEACQELRQILASHHHMMEDFAIIRTNNPLPHEQVVSEVKRPRSFSVGDARNYPMSLVY